MSDNMNIVMAINMGGDDFIVKPFDINVLIAKVQAMLRRTYSFAESTNIIEHNGCILNINDQTFTYNGKKLEQAGLIDYIKTKKVPEYRQI